MQVLPRSQMRNKLGILRAARLLQIMGEGKEGLNLMFHIFNWPQHYAQTPLLTCQ